MTVTDTDAEVVAEYAHNCRLLREPVANDPDRWIYEGPMGPVKEFRRGDKARTYAAVQTVTGGFREEKTGERGVPPAVASEGGHALVAYLACQPTMSITWAARFFDIEEGDVQRRINKVRQRADAMRDRSTTDHDHNP